MIQYVLSHVFRFRLYVFPPLTSHTFLQMFPFCLNLALREYQRHCHCPCPEHFLVPDIKLNMGIGNPYTRTKYIAHDNMVITYICFAHAHTWSCYSSLVCQVAYCQGVSCTSTFILLKLHKAQNMYPYISLYISTDYRSPKRPRRSMYNPRLTPIQCLRQQ